MLVICSQDGGLIWYNTRSNTSISRKYPITSSLSSLLGWYHSTLIIDTGRMWVGNLPGGDSFILDPLTGDERFRIRCNGPDSLFTKTNALYCDQRLYTGGWGPGITSFQADVQRTEHYAPLKDEVTSMVQWKNGTILTGTKINGIVQLDKDLKPVQRYAHQRRSPNTLINDRVRCMMTDRSGTLWVGTAGGVSLYNPHVWQMHLIDLYGGNNSDNSDLTFHALQQDHDGTIRISTSHGFFLVDPTADSVRQIQLSYDEQPLELTGLFEPFPDKFMLGTETGFFRYDKQNEKIIPSAKRSISSNLMFQVRSIFSDTFPNGPKLIIGALGWSNTKVDPLTFEAKEWRGRLEGAIPPIGMLNCTKKSTNGRYWSSYTNGVINWSKSKLSASDSTVSYTSTARSEHRRLPSSDVSDLLIHRDTVWVAMRDAGLASIANDTVKFFPPPAHTSNDLLGLAMDGRGRVWCTTNNGLSCFDPATLEWIHVPINDGGTFTQLTKCIAELQDGTMAFCVDNSLITFDPNAFNAFPDLPLPYLTGVNNTWGAVLPNPDGIVEIAYRASSFDATVSALWPMGPTPLEFVYRLEGVEKESHVVDARTPIRYAGVPVGEHALLVRVRDAYGRVGPEVTLFTVKVPAPFWQSWWFYVALIILGAIVMWLISRFRQQQTMRLQSMRDHIARDLHDDVGSTLGSINFYSEALKRKLDEIDDPMAKVVATRIGNSSREMIDRMADIVWSVDPKNDDAGSLIERMKGYASDLVATRGIELKWNTPSSLEHVKLGTDHRRNLFMIFKEAMYNSVKYAACTQIHVSLNIIDRKIELTISDNGKGFDPENVDSYNGNGLPGMQTRAKAMGGQVHIESSPGNGTAVIAIVPINATLPRSGD